MGLQCCIAIFNRCQVNGVAVIHGLGDKKLCQTHIKQLNPVVDYGVRVGVEGGWHAKKRPVRVYRPLLVLK